MPIQREPEGSDRVAGWGGVRLRRYRAASDACGVGFGVCRAALPLSLHFGAVSPLRSLRSLRSATLLCVPSVSLRSVPTCLRYARYAAWCS
jgi:hypothetical protein